MDSHLFCDREIKILREENDYLKKENEELREENKELHVIPLSPKVFKTLAENEQLQSRIDRAVDMLKLPGIHNESVIKILTGCDK